jgi:glycosyltransferase involved in cell wall biosynthesis
LFNLFYGLLYRLNLRANDLVIVQQAWLRQIFLQRFGARCVAVAHPVASAPPPAAPPTHPGRAVFFYPTLPRVHKNVETLAEAARLLAACRPDLDFEVRLTITGDENRYAAWLRRRFGDVGPLRFVGRLDRVAMAAAYRSASMLVFPSRLETWGLPITEARSQGLPILAADLPYAHETVGDYDRVRFFAPEDAAELADLMAEYIEGTLRFESHGMPCPAEPFAEDWDALVNMLVTLADGKARR